VTPIRKILSFLTALLCLAAAITFFLWAINSNPEQMIELRGGLFRYISYFPLGALIGGTICGMMYLFGARQDMTSLLQASCLLYFAFLKFAGLPIIPWIIGLLAMAAFFLNRRKLEDGGSSVLLLHLMGTISGLYMSFHLHEFLSGWDPFTDVVASIWLVLIAPIS
jgi:hypothetical protein